MMMGEDIINKKWLWTLK